MTTLHDSKSFPEIVIHGHIEFKAIAADQINWLYSDR